jgi:hypothetical protein
MTKVSIAFAGSAGLGGFPDFPASLAQQLQEEFPATSVRFLSDPAQRRTELADTDVLFTLRLNRRNSPRQAIAMAPSPFG